MPRRSLTYTLLALASLAVPGCGDPDGFRFPVYPAGGTVQYAGKPVARAIVRFHPTDPATTKIPDGKTGPPLALTTETEPDGTFALSSYLADDGVPAGDYVVTVAMASAETDVENRDAAPSRRGPGAAKAEVAKAFRDRATTPLKATVKPGENRFTFELK